jgi:hypothetical protein
VRKDLRSWGGEKGADGKCEGGRGEGGRRGRVEERGRVGGNGGGWKEAEEEDKGLRTREEGGGRKKG